MYTFATVAIFFMFGVGNNVVLADSAHITNFLLNGGAQDIIFNPNNGESVNIDVTANTPVKFTRIYICEESQSCTGTAGTNIRYFSQSDPAVSVSKSWNGKTSGDKEVVPEGVYKVKVSMTEGKSAAVLEEGQFKMIVNYSSSGSGGTSTSTDITTDTNTGTSTSSTTTTTSSNSGGTTVVYSVHYIQEDLSDYEEATTFEVGAGRARLSYVNSPVSFTAKHKVSKDLSAKNCDYIWNFGDGVSLTGEKVEHIYKYAGEYNVILNGICGDLKSVARTAVRVVMPNISVNTKADGAVEIFNQGKYEINLYNWKIQSGNTAFIFPQDTIISANKSVTFAPEYLKLTDYNNGIILVDASNKAVAQSNANLAGINPGREISLEEFTKFALAYQSAGTRQPATLTATASTSLNLSALNHPLTLSLEKARERATTSSEIPMTAAVADVIINTEENKPGFWGKIFHPIRTIKETFYQ